MTVFYLKGVFVMTIDELNKMATEYGYPLPDHTEEGYRVSARKIYAALKISLPFVVWFAKARREIDFEKGEDYTPAKSIINGRPLKDYNVTLTIAGDMGLMCRTSSGEHFSNFYWEYRQALRIEKLNQIEKRIEKMEKKLGIQPVNI